MLGWVAHVFTACRVLCAGCDALTAGAEERLLAPGDREQEFDGPETSMGTGALIMIGVEGEYTPLSCCVPATGDDGASLDPAAPSQVQYSRLAFHENGNNTPVHRAEL